MRGAHLEHAAHVRDARRVEAQRLVERRRTLPRRKERIYEAERGAGQEAWGRWPGGSASGMHGEGRTESCAGAGRT